MLATVCFKSNCCGFHQPKILCQIPVPFRMTDAMMLLSDPHPHPFWVLITLPHGTAKQQTEMISLLLPFVGSRPGHRPTDHQLDPWTCDWLFQALHAAWHQYYDQEAREAEARCLLVHGPLVLWDLDVHHIRLHRRQHRPVPRQPLQPIRMADRGLRQWTHIYKRFYHIK